MWIDFGGVANYAERAFGGGSVTYLLEGFRVVCNLFAIAGFSLDPGSGNCVHRTIMRY